MAVLCVLELITLPDKFTLDFTIDGKRMIAKKKTQKTKKNQAHYNLEHVVPDFKPLSSH